MTQQAPAKENKSETFKGGFGSFSITDVPAAKDFYSEALGLVVTGSAEGLSIEIPGSGENLFLYHKENHKPATFTVFNLVVDDVEKAVDELSGRGIKFLQYGEPMNTNEKGIFRGAEKGSGPNIAWFEDPSGNILSVIERMD